MKFLDPFKKYKPITNMNERRANSGNAERCSFWRISEGLKGMTKTLRGYAYHPKMKKIKGVLTATLSDRTYAVVGGTFYCDRSKLHPGKKAVKARKRIRRLMREMKAKDKARGES